MKLKSLTTALFTIGLLILLSTFQTPNLTAQSLPHLTDSLTLTSKQKKTILLMGNEIDRLNAETSLKDSIILTDRQRIEWYKTLDTIRCNQLAESNLKVSSLEKSIKKERVKIVIWQIIAGLSLLSALLVP
jgi:hypothetical protein